MPRPKPSLSVRFARWHDEGMSLFHEVSTMEDKLHAFESALASLKHPAKSVKRAKAK